MTRIVTTLSTSLDRFIGSGPLPGAPLFVLTHHVPSEVPRGEPPYTFVTDGIQSAVEQARAARTSP